MDLSKPVYCASAIFKCTCCGYATEVYSDTEWFKITQHEICGVCKIAGVRIIAIPIIYRDDIDDDIPLHPQCADLPKEVRGCAVCCSSFLRPVHWTKIQVICPPCRDNRSEKECTMVFSHYVQAKNIRTFYDECVMRAKPSYPLLNCIDKDGHEYFTIGSIIDLFSAS